MMKDDKVNQAIMDVEEAAYQCRLCADAIMGYDCLDLTGLDGNLAAGLREVLLTSLGEKLAATSDSLNRAYGILHDAKSE